MKKIFVLLTILYSSTAVCQSCYNESKLSVIGSMAAGKSNGFFLQDARAGIWTSGQNGFIIMAGLSQYYDTLWMHDKNTLVGEAGFFSRFDNRLTSTLTIGKNSQGWFIRPSILYRVGDAFNIQVAYQKSFFIGFLVDFKRSLK